LAQVGVNNMADVKKTKNELKKQKDALRRFTRYLPTLALKKQQLQIEIAKASHMLEAINTKISELEAAVKNWSAVFGENIAIEEFISVKAVREKIENIAGIDTPVFLQVDYEEKGYDYMAMPLWVDAGIEAIKQMTELRCQGLIMKKKQRLLADELRITAQRVNLFEKIKIPESKGNIRKINIVLGDLQTAAVVTGKIAKKKIEEKHAAA
jgi:V/A-type H+/Na+-transporting ATPase subunit D